MADITLFTQPNCGPCAGVKGQLTKRRIPYTTVDISVDDAAASLLRDKGCSGTPVLRHGGTFYRTPQEILDFIRSRRRMKPMSASKAWLAVTLFVVGFNMRAPQGGTLSEQFDVWIVRRPVTARLGVLVVALHVANLLPATFDPVHRLFVGLGTFKDRRRARLDPRIR